MSKPVVLVTGATGAFGSYVISQFVGKDVQLILLVRAESDQKARERVQKESTISSDTEVYRADLSINGLGLDQTKYVDLCAKVTHILHAAADTRFTLPIEDARARNVATTERMLDLATKCTKLTRFLYLSSALVAGKRSGAIFEDEFEHEAGFINTYEQSKYEAEELVRKHLTRLPILILRPPLVISKPPKNYQGPVNLLSHSLNLIQKGFLPLLPGTPESVFDMVDGTFTARVTVTLLLKDLLRYHTYHIANGSDAITAGKILEIVEAHLQRKLPVRFCGDMRAFKQALWWRSLLRPWMRVVYKRTASYLPELAYPKTFDNRHLKEELGIEHLTPTPEEVFRSILT
jgi:thioester reductase-like protein